MGIAFLSLCQNAEFLGLGLAQPKSNFPKVKPRLDKSLSVALYGKLVEKAWETHGFNTTRKK